MEFSPEMLADRGEVRYQRTYPASAAVLYEAMLTPAHLTHFWGPIGMSAPLDKIDVEPVAGGRYNLTMRSDDTGDEFPMESQILELEEPNRIVFYEPGFDMTTTITFTDNGDGTCEAVTHQVNVPAPFRSPEAQAGMETSFDRLVSYLESLAR